MLSQIREKLNPPTDNEQLLRLKRMSKSPHSNPLLRDLAMYITVRKLNILLKMLTSVAQRDKTLEEKVTFIDTKKIAQHYSNPGGALEKLNHRSPRLTVCVTYGFHNMSKYREHVGRSLGLEIC